MMTRFHDSLSELSKLRRFLFLPVGWIVLLMLAPFFAFSPFALIATAQVSTPPGVVEEKIQQWVQAKKTLAAERADWAEEKQQLKDLNAIRRTELAELQAIVTNLSSRLNAAVTKREDLEDSEKKLQTELAALEQRVVAWEQTLLPKLSALPQPLLDTLADPIARVKNRRAKPGEKVDARVRDIVFILAEISAFHHDLRIHSELREINGESREVDVLYLGLAQAFYVNKDGSFAGRGLPGSDGWTWSPSNALASDIRSAIDMARKDDAPGMIRLPIHAGKPALGEAP